MPPEHFAATLLFVMRLSEKHRYKMRDYTCGILQQFADRRITKRTLPAPEFYTERASLRFINQTPLRGENESKTAKSSCTVPAASRICVVCLDFASGGPANRTEVGSSENGNRLDPRRDHT